MKSNQNNSYPISNKNDFYDRNLLNNQYLPYNNQLANFINYNRSNPGLMLNLSPSHLYAFNPVHSTFPDRNIILLCIENNNNPNNYPNNFYYIYQNLSEEKSAFENEDFSEFYYD